jgi:hypothetical protein
VFREGCAHIDQGHDLGGSCPAKTTEREVEGTSTGDGTGSASFGGRVTAELCIGSAHDVSLEPGSTLIV